MKYSLITLIVRDLRCDGRLARILMDAGYAVSNPCLSIVAHHLHGVDSSSSSRMSATTEVQDPNSLRLETASSSPSSRTKSTRSPGAHGRQNAKSSSEGGSAEVKSEMASGVDHDLRGRVGSGTYSGDTQVPGEIAHVPISDRWLF